MTTETDNKTAVYELAFLLRTGETDAVLSEFLTKAGATILTKGAIVPIQLTYPIKKQPSAMFGFYHLTFKEAMSPTHLSEELNLKEYLLRHLFVKPPKRTGRAAAKERAAGDRKTREASLASSVSPAASSAHISRLDSLSNEKLEQTLEEILK
ncbi:MAG: 30S ribosomal protein S6 [bacterium]|nr:30S ribosomal protein S6 [bacterium]